MSDQGQEPDPDVCPHPNCGQPYSKIGVSDKVLIRHEEAAQARTCVVVRESEGDADPRALVVLHSADDLAADGEPAPASVEGTPDPSELTGDHERVFDAIRSCVHDGPTTMVEIKGQCRQPEYGDLGPDEVDRIISELDDAGYINAPRAAHVDIAPGVV